jgi:hypothetical protein
VIEDRDWNGIAGPKGVVVVRLFNDEEQVRTSDSRNAEHIGRILLAAVDGAFEAHVTEVRRTATQLAAKLTEFVGHPLHASAGLPNVADSLQPVKAVRLICLLASSSLSGKGNLAAHPLQLSGFCGTPLAVRVVKHGHNAAIRQEPVGPFSETMCGRAGEQNDIGIKNREQLPGVALKTSREHWTRITVPMCGAPSDIGEGDLVERQTEPVYVEPE